MYGEVDVPGAGEANVVALLLALSGRSLAALTGS